MSIGRTSFPAPNRSNENAKPRRRRRGFRRLATRYQNVPKLLISASLGGGLGPAARQFRIRNLMRTDRIETPSALSFRVGSESFVLYLSLSLVAVSGQSSRPMAWRARTIAAALMTSGWVPLPAGGRSLAQLGTYACWKSNSDIPERSSGMLCRRDSTFTRQPPLRSRNWRYRRPKASSVRRLSRV